MGLRRSAVVAPFVFMGAMDGDAFTQYIREQLGPELLPGDVVVVDGLGTHRSLSARKAIEEFGAELVPLPPYSPDLTPVEECGSKVKAYVRGREPRTAERVHEVMAEALRSVTPLDKLGWFRDRAAYLIPPLPK